MSATGKEFSARGELIRLSLDRPHTDACTVSRGLPDGDNRKGALGRCIQVRKAAEGQKA